MLEKQSKIHSLGPKKMSLTGRAFYNSASQNGFGNKPLLPVTTVSQPQIRYLLVQHPQFDALVKELTALRTKYDQLLQQFEQKQTQQSLRANIQEVIESTHDIQAHMSRIVEDANRMSTGNYQKQNSPLTLSNQALKAQHEKQCLHIIQTVNRATQKIEQLQRKNSKLQNQISSHKQWRQSLEKQNKRLKLMLQNMQREKEEEIQKLKRQVQNHSLKNKSYKQQETIAKENVNMEKKISNAHYLQESRQSNNMNEDVSGFSRLSINNGQASRVSRIYE